MTQALHAALATAIGDGISRSFDEAMIAACNTIAGSKSPSRTFDEACIDLAGAFITVNNSSGARYYLETSTGIANVAAGIGIQNIALSNSTLQETDCPMTTVGSLTCDAPLDIITWSLTDDAGGKFKIWGAKKDQVALAWTLLDRTSTTSYNITVKATGLSRSKTASFTITIADVTDPGELSVQPIIAMNFLSGVTLSGNSITNVTAKWAATGGDVTGHSGAEPQIDNTGPCGNNTYAKLPNDSYFEFTSTGAMSNFDVSIVCCFDVSGQNRWFFASGSNTAGFIRGGTTSVTFFWNDATNTTLTYLTALPINQWGILRFQYTAAGGANNVKAFWNNLANGTATKASAAMTFTRIGKTGTTATTGPWRMSAATIYNSVLAGADATAFSPYLTRFRAQRVYVANSGNDASLTPWLSSTPKQTVASAWTAMLYRGSAVILNPGDTFTSVPVAPQGNGGLPGARFYFGTEDPYSATRAIVRGGTDLSAATWTDNGDSTFSTACATQPSICWWIKNSDLTLQTSVVRVKAGTPTTTADTFSWAAGTITLRLDGTNPTGQNIQGASGTGWTPNLDYLMTAGINYRLFASSAGIDTGTPNATQADVINCGTHFHFSDGNNQTGTGIINISMCDSLWNGEVGGANGDGFSSHGTTTTNYWGCISMWNMGGGFRHLRGPTMTHDRCYAEGNYSGEYLQLASGGANGLFDITNSIGVLHTDLSGIDSAVSIEASIGGTWASHIYNCVFYSDSAGTGIGIDGANNTGQVTVRNTIIDNFSTGLNASAGGVISEDYNCLFGNTTARTNVGTGAHSIASNPSFTAPTATPRDFTLQGGSPASGTGTDLSLATDYTNKRRATGAQSMGVYI